MCLRFAISAFVLLAGFAIPASAQAQDSTEHTTVTNFGAWALHCQPPQEQGAEPLCVVAETIETPSNKLIGVISIGRAHPGDPINMVVTLPPNISFPSTVHIRTDKEDKWGVELQWQRCIPGACIAGTEMNPATLAHWSGLGSDGKIVFTDAAGDEASVPMSLRGFGDAYKAMNHDTPPPL
jgi:invasion protein IalB